MLLLFFVLIILLKISSEKCWYLKNKLKISCGNHFETNKFSVNWNYRNSKIAENINKFCEDCNFENFIFELEKKEVYEISFKNNRIKIFNTRTQQTLFNNNSNYKCFSCFSNLFV